MAVMALTKDQDVLCHTDNTKGLSLVILMVLKDGKHI